MNQELTVLFTHGWENCTINVLKTLRFKNEQYISLNVDYTCIGILTISWLQACNKANSPKFNGFTLRFTGR